jgi:hypothetical protein
MRHRLRPSRPVTCGVMTIKRANLTPSQPIGARFLPHGPSFPPPGAMVERLHLSTAQQHVQALQVEGQTDQAPLASHGGQAPQRELAKAQHFLDDPDHGLHRRLAQRVDGPADIGLQLVGHLDQRAGILGRRRRLCCKPCSPTLVVRFTARGDVGLNPTRGQLGDVLRAEVAIIQASVLRCRTSSQLRC